MSIRKLRIVGVVIGISTGLAFFLSCAAYNVIAHARWSEDKMAIVVIISAGIAIIVIASAVGFCNKCLASEEACQKSAKG